MQALHYPLNSRCIVCVNCSFRRWQYGGSALYDDQFLAVLNGLGPIVVADAAPLHVLAQNYQTTLCIQCFDNNAFKLTASCFSAVFFSRLGVLALFRRRRCAATSAVHIHTHSFCSVFCTVINHLSMASADFSILFYWFLS